MKPRRHLIIAAVLSVFALAAVVPMFANEADAAAPEPLSVGLMGIGLLGLALLRRR